MPSRELMKRSKKLAHAKPQKIIGLLRLFAALREKKMAHAKTPRRKAKLMAPFATLGELYSVA